MTIHGVPIGLCALRSPEIRVARGNRAAALREMWRVLDSNGRLAVAVWASFDHSCGYVALTDVVEHLTNSEAVGILKAPFVLGDPSEIPSLFRLAEIPEPRIGTYSGFAAFASIDEFLRIEVKGSPLDAALNWSEYELLRAEARTVLSQFCDHSGRLSFPMDAHIVTAFK